MMNIDQNEFHEFTTDVQNCSLLENVLYFISEKLPQESSVLVGSSVKFHIVWNKGYVSHREVRLLMQRPLFECSNRSVAP